MVWLDPNLHLSGSKAHTLNDEMMLGKGLAHREGKVQPLVTGQPLTEVAGRKMTAIKSLTTSRPWGACGQASGVCSLFVVELQAEFDRGKEEAPAYTVAMGKLTGLLGV